MSGRIVCPCPCCAKRRAYMLGRYNEAKRAVAIVKALESDGVTIELITDAEAQS